MLINACRLGLVVTTSFYGNHFCHNQRTGVTSSVMTQLNFRQCYESLKINRLLF